MAAMLKMEGFEVVVAENGKIGVEVAKRELSALIVARLARGEEHAAGTGAPNLDSAQPLIDKLLLTPRESEVLLWVAQGKANGDIALIFSTTESTVKNISNISSKSLVWRIAVQHRFGRSKR